MTLLISIVTVDASMNTAAKVDCSFLLGLFGVTVLLATRFYFIEACFCNAKAIFLVIVPILLSPFAFLRTSQSCILMQKSRNELSRTS